MKTLLDVIVEGFVNEQPMKAVKKDTNRVVTYTNKANYQAVLKKGTHRQFDPVRDKDLEDKPKKDDSSDLDRVKAAVADIEDDPKKSSDQTSSRRSTQNSHDKTVEDWAFTTRDEIAQRKQQADARRKRAIDYVEEVRTRYNEGRPSKEKIKKSDIDTLFDIIHGKGIASLPLGQGEDREVVTTEELKELIQSKSAAGQVNSLASEALTVTGLQAALSFIKDGDSDVGTIADKVCDELDYDKRAPDGILSKQWVNASCGQVYSTLKGLEGNGYDLSDIEGVYWDTARGNKLAGTTGHGTSSDLFIKMNDGTVVGVSLKKDGQIIFANLGTQKYLETVVGDLAPNDPARDILMPGGENLTDVVQRQSVEKINDVLSDPDNLKEFVDAVGDMCEEGSDLNKNISSSPNNRERYCSSLGGLVEKINNGETNLSGPERTLLCRATSTYDKGGDDRFKKMGIDGTCREQDSKITEAMIEASKESPAFKRRLTGTVVKGLHITAHLGMSRRPPPDTMISSFGTGEVIDRERVYDLFKLSGDDRKEVERLVESGDIDAVEDYFSDRIAVEAGPKGFIANLDVGEEDRVTLGIIDNRAKGVGEKPNTLIEPSKDLKKLLGGAVGKTPRRFSQPEESTTPELRKLVRDVVINRLKDYGN